MSQANTAAGGAIQPEDSLKRRYFYKVGGSFLALPITLVIQAVTARMLGPAAYGTFTFLNNFFSQAVNFFDGGISAGFFSKLSQRPNEHGLVRFFWGVVAVVSTLVLLLVSAISAAGLSAILWPDQTMRYVWMAAIWGLLTWYSQVMNKALDAYGITVSGEIARFQQKVLGLALILLMYRLKRFALVDFYLYQYAILLFLCVSWAFALKRHGWSVLPRVRLAYGQLSSYCREFFNYSSPLITLGMATLVGGILDRWLLQRFAGSVQQGFFGLSSQIGGLCFLVSGAITPLLWREIARASADRNVLRMQELFGRTVRIIYVITAYLAVFIAFQAKEVSWLLGGDAFKAAALPIAIMVFYPIHQTYGQLTSVFLLGTGQTKLARNVGLMMIVFGLALALWLLGPRAQHGLSLGATGLATKLVVEQVVGVNLQLWFIARFLRVSFGQFAAHQVGVLIILISIGWSTTTVVAHFVQNPLLAFLGSGVVYTLACATALVVFPGLITMSRKELKTQLISPRHFQRW